MDFLKVNSNCILFLSLILLLNCSIMGNSIHLQEKTVNNTTFEKSQIAKMNVTFNFNNLTLYGEIYYPTIITKEIPGIILCQGSGSYSSAYSWISSSLAQNDYIVFSFDYPGQGFSEGFFPAKYIYIESINLLIRPTSFIESKIQYLVGNWNKATIRAIHYFLDESPLSKEIDHDHIGLIGHSSGGLIVTNSIYENINISAIVALSHSNPKVKQLSIPIQFQCGDRDIFSRSIFNVLLNYQIASSPKELILIQQGTHMGFSNVFNSNCPCPPWQKEVSFHYLLAWFDYFIKQDSDALQKIITPIPHLSKMIDSRYNLGDGENILG